MKKIIAFLWTVVLIQTIQGQPTTPNPSPPPPPCPNCPPGGVPIDENIYIAFAVAVVLGFLFLCNKVKKPNALNSYSDI